jgi:RsiW-degrading membrane proteinase PrsW (M82 family)
MSRNILYLVIGALAVVTAVLSYQFYQERQKATGVEISIGERGISIEKK